MIDDQLKNEIRQTVFDLMNDFNRNGTADIVDGTVNCNQDIREAVASMMRDFSNGDNSVAVADDMVNSISQATGSDGESFLTQPEDVSMFAFDGEEIGEGLVYRARQPTIVSAVQISDDFSGYAYVKVPLTVDGDTVIETKDSFPSVTDDTSYLLLYKFEDGKVVKDYRNALNAQMWE